MYDKWCILESLPACAAAQLDRKPFGFMVHIIFCYHVTQVYTWKNRILDVFGYCRDCFYKNGILNGSWSSLICFLIMQVAFRLLSCVSGFRIFWSMNVSSQLDAENVNFSIRLSKSIDVAHVHGNWSRGLVKKKENWELADRATRCCCDDFLWRFRLSRFPGPFGPSLHTRNW